MTQAELDVVVERVIAAMGKRKVRKLHKPPPRTEIKRISAACVRVVDATTHSSVKRKALRLFTSTLRRLADQIDLDSCA